MTSPPTVPSRCDGVVCFAAVDWWYHNRGHSECQIMRRLSGRAPVLWINSLGMRTPTPGKSDIVLRRYARKLASTIKGLRRDPSGMWVYSPLFVPRYSRRFAAINGFLVAQQVALLTRCLGMKAPSVFVTNPTAAPAVGRGHWVRTIFNRSDDFTKFPEANAAFVREMETMMFRLADATLYVNRGLFARECANVPDARYIGHGVDFSHFDRKRRVLEACPAEIRDLPRPIVGFYGGLRDYTVDLDLMIKTARSLPTGTLLVIGPTAMEISPLLAEPNVAYLGPIQYERIPDYASQFDVGIMPWHENEWIRACNPIKFKEYLALGFPIVTTDFDQLGELRSLVYVSRSHDEFVGNVARALAERDESLVQRRKASVADDSWDQVAETVAALLQV